jgi:predicted MFS family arabinose efflux permease
MKLLRSPLYIICTILGIGGGFAYYYFIGCSTGNCPLKSNPWIMMGYGALIGYLAADLIQWIVDKRKKKE